MQNNDGRSQDTFVYLLDDFHTIRNFLYNSNTVHRKPKGHAIELMA